MWDAGPQQMATLLVTHWEVAAAVGGSLAAATGGALALLPRAGRESVSLWMMGAASHESWATSFTALFDAVFGAKHLRLRCFLLSTLISMLTVVALWMGLGTLNAISIRLAIIDTFWQVLALTLFINVLADYVSLMETRWLLGWLKTPRAVWVQALVLLGDVVITAAIIAGALWGAQALGYTRLILGDNRDGVAEIVGLFSPLSVSFYSTFVTSIWTWGFIFSTWLMRLLARARILHSVYAEHPGRSLCVALAASSGVIGFLGSAAFGALTTPGDQGLSIADRALSNMGLGEVPLLVRSLTQDEAAQLAWTLDACRGGVTPECLKPAEAPWKTDGAIAAQYWSATCYEGDVIGCTSLGVLHNEGIGMDPDPAEAARLYQQACDGGNANGCTNLGLLYHEGIGMEPDPAEAARLYRQGCDGDNANGCTNLGFLHAQGIGMDPDPAEAARLYRQGCDGGNANGCTNLGVLHHQGIGMEPDLTEAARLYRQGCESGDGNGCTNLGIMLEYGLGIGSNPREAKRLYQQACDTGDTRACNWSAEMGE